MKIELIQSKFGLGEINSEIYMAIMSELNSRLAEIRRELEDAREKFIEHDEIYQSND